MNKHFVKHPFEKNFEALIEQDCKIYAEVKSYYRNNVYCASLFEQTEGEPFDAFLKRVIDVAMNNKRNMPGRKYLEVITNGEYYLVLPLFN
jgi:hypothetical protein